MLPLDKLRAIILGLLVLVSIAVTLFILRFDRAAFSRPGEPLGTELAWVPVRGIAEADQRYVDHVIESYFDDAEDSPTPRSPDPREAREELKDLLAYARFPLPSGGELLFIHAPKRLTFCADMIFIFGSAGERGDRRLLTERCAATYRLLQRPDQSMPDLILSLSDLIDDVFAWKGDDWAESPDEIVESFKMIPDDAGPRDGPQYRVPPDLPASKFGHLAHHAGSYDAVPIFSDPSVRRYLRQGLGEHYLTFLSLYQIRGPWFFEDGCLMGMGGRNHFFVQYGVVLAICFRDDSIHAAMRMDDHVVLLSPSRRYEDVPETVRDYVQWTFVPLSERLAPRQNGDDYEYGPDVLKTPPAEGFVWLRPHWTGTTRRDCQRSFWCEITAAR